MKGDFFFEYGVQVCPYIRGTAIGEETIQLGVFEESVHSFHYVEEEILTLLFREAKRVAVDLVLPDICPEKDSIFFIGDDIAESVLSEGTQPK